MNIKRYNSFYKVFEEYDKSDEDSSFEEIEKYVKSATNRIMNALYGMDEKYEEDVAVSYNVNLMQVKLILENEEEVNNISKYLEDNYYRYTVNNLDIIIQL